MQYVTEYYSDIKLNFRQLSFDKIFPYNNHNKIVDIANHTLSFCKQDWILNIGDDHNTLVQFLLHVDIDHNKFITAQTDMNTKKYLNKNFPNITVIDDDFSNIPIKIPTSSIENISTIFVNLSNIIDTKSTIRHMIDSCFEVLRNDGQIILFTHSPVFAPLSSNKSINAKLLKVVFQTMLPTFVWRYTKSHCFN